jgi:acyl-coenzyme A thioesterase PaaI-like protein
VSTIPNSKDSAKANADEGTGPLGLRARARNGCIVCGEENPHGLRIRYVREPDGAIAAEWRPTKDWEGFEGIVHGGIISTVLDEAMSKAVAAMNCEALTGELRVRFRRHVEAGETLRVRGWIVGKVKRVVKAEATLTAANGSERAHAWARFLALPGQMPPQGTSGRPR